MKKESSVIVDRWGYGPARVAGEYAETAPSAPEKLSVRSAR
jgi:hypothetical protein